MKTIGDVTQMMYFYTIIFDKTPVLMYYFFSKVPLGNVLIDIYTIHIPSY